MLENPYPPFPIHVLFPSCFEHETYGTTSPGATRDVEFATVPAIATSSGSATFVGNGGPIAVDPGIQVTANVSITGATVTINQLWTYNGGTFTNTGGFGESFSAYAVAALP